MSQPMANLLVSLNAAAEMLGIHKRTLYHLIAAGEFPQPVKVGGSSRIPVSDIERYVDELRRKRGK